MSHPKEYRVWFRIARRLGWTIRQTQRSFKLYDSRGRFRISCALTPSDWRALRNTRARLRHAGLPV